MRPVLLASTLALAGCATEWREDYDRLTATIDHSYTHLQRAPSSPTTDPELDKLLSDSLDLNVLVAAALDRNPELRESLARAKAGLAEVKRVSSFDDPMLKYEAWGVPINQPGAFNRDQTNLFGLRQDIPFPGNLSLKGEAALRDAESMYQMYRDRQIDVVSRVKKAFFDYYALQKEIDIHLEHVKILEDFEKISDAKFRTGTVSQQDVLKPQVELVMLHNDVLAIEQKLGSVRASLNALLNRPSNAPLGKPSEITPPDEKFDVQELTAQALTSRPDVLAAQLRARSTKTSLEVAGREATLPNFSIGADYWQMPGVPNDAYGVMFSINLPWFTGQHRAEVAKFEHSLHADEAAVDSARNKASLEVRDAFLRVEAARKSVVLFKGELLPKSQQSVEVSRASYEKDKASFLDLLDAERSQRDIKLKYHQVLAQYEWAVADLERAVGTKLRRTR